MINHLLLSFCTQSGGPSVILAPQIAPPDYCGLSWFACLFCFWPVAICAIVKSNEVTNTDSGIHEFQLYDLFISVLVLELNAVLLFWKSGGLAWSGLEYQKCIHTHSYRLYTSVPV